MHKTLMVLTREKVITFILLLLFPFFCAYAVDAQQTPLQNTVANEIAQQLHIKAVSEEIHVDEVYGENNKKSGLPQFDLTTASSQIFWLLVMFAIMYVFFAKKTLPSLESTIELRRSTIRDDVAAAGKLTTDIEVIKIEYETIMKKARNDAQQAVLAVEDAIRDIAEKQNSIFKERSMHTIAGIESKAQAEKSRIMGELEQVASDVAVEIISSLTDLKADNKKITEAVKNRLALSSETVTKMKAA